VDEGVAPRAEGEPQSEISFRLTLSAEGQVGPMLNLLMAPMLEPDAGDLASQIAARVEELHCAAEPMPEKQPAGGVR
jgi:hypothetical protein